MSDDGIEDLGDILPGGNHVYRKRNTAGGYTYYSDECSILTTVWDTCIASEATLLAVMLCEKRRRYVESVEKSRQEIAKRNETRLDDPN